jgi:hypothetical protein
MILYEWHVMAMHLMKGIVATMIWFELENNKLKSHNCSKALFSLTSYFLQQSATRHCDVQTVSDLPKSDSFHMVLPIQESFVKQGSGVCTVLEW